MLLLSQAINEFFWYISMEWYRGAKHSVVVMPLTLVV